MPENDQFISEEYALAIQEAPVESPTSAESRSNEPTYIINNPTAPAILVSFEDSEPKYAAIKTAIHVDVYGTADGIERVERGDRTVNKYGDQANAVIKRTCDKFSQPVTPKTLGYKFNPDQTRAFDRFLTQDLTYALVSTPYALEVTEGKHEIQPLVYQVRAEQNYLAPAVCLMIGEDIDGSPQVYLMSGPAGDIAYFSRHKQIPESGQILGDRFPISPDSLRDFNTFEEIIDHLMSTNLGTVITESGEEHLIRPIRQQLIAGLEMLWQLPSNQERLPKMDSLRARDQIMKTLHDWDTDWLRTLVGTLDLRCLQDREDGQQLLNSPELLTDVQPQNWFDLYSLCHSIYIEVPVTGRQTQQVRLSEYLHDNSTLVADLLQKRADAENIAITTIMHAYVDGSNAQTIANGLLDAADIRQLGAQKAAKIRLLAAAQESKTTGLIMGTLDQSENISLLAGEVGVEGARLLASLVIQKLSDERIQLTAANRRAYQKLHASVTQALGQIEAGQLDPKDFSYQLPEAANDFILPATTTTRPE